jgi:hypothetical protein
MARTGGSGIRASVSFPYRNPAQHDSQQPVQVLCQGCRGRTRQPGVRADNHVNTVRQLTYPRAHESPQDPLRTVPDHRVADSLGDDKTDPRRLTRARVGRVGMHHHELVARTRSACSACPPEDCGEISGGSQPMTPRQHAPSLRRTVRSDPFGDEQPGWRGRRGSACADGSRGSWPGDGCSAGTCACSRGFSVTAQPCVDLC